MQHSHSHRPHTSLVVAAASQNPAQEAKCAECDFGSERKPHLGDKVHIYVDTQGLANGKVYKTYAIIDNPTTPPFTNGKVKMDLSVDASTLEQAMNGNYSLLFTTLPSTSRYQALITFHYVRYRAQTINMVQGVVMNSDSTCRLEINGDNLEMFYVQEVINPPAPTLPARRS